MADKPSAEETYANNYKKSHKRAPHALREEFFCARDPFALRVLVVAKIAARIPDARKILQHYELWRA